MASHTRTMVMFGSGPSIGRAVAVEFGARGFDQVILVSRNLQRLEEDKAAVKAAASKPDTRVDIVIGDMSSEVSMAKAFQKIDTISESIEAIVVNGAHVAPSQLFEYTAEEIVNDFKITTIGLYLISQWAIPKLQALSKKSPASKPSIIVISGVLHLDPWPTFFSLSLAKTAQRNLVDSLHRVYNNQGIHIGLVLVGGRVLPECKVLTPPNIAQVTWDFFDQETSRDKLEVVMYEP